MQIDRKTIEAWLKDEIDVMCVSGCGEWFELSVAAIQNIAQRAAEQEREACAKVAEQSARINAAICGLEVQDSIAARIRARTNG